MLQNDIIRAYGSIGRESVRQDDGFRLPSHGKDPVVVGVQHSESVLGKRRDESPLLLPDGGDGTSGATPHDGLRDISGGRLIELPIEQELKESYLTYAMSVIVSRALPDVPVQFLRRGARVAWADGRAPLVAYAARHVDIADDAVVEQIYAFLKAGSEAGHPLTDDICGYQQEGFGLLDQTIHRGERWSAAKGYLDPIRNRPNLTIETDRLVRRVVIENGRATGIELQGRDRAITMIRAQREVILSAGAVGSPHLLMLSGIGPADHLQATGIPVFKDRPGVGANLHDHPDFVMKFELKKPISLLPNTKGMRRIMVGLRWLLDRGGVCASNHFETVACLRSGPGVDYPDLQLTIVPIAMQVDGWTPMPVHAFQIHIGLMRAHSRGSIRLRDADPTSPPRIQVNYGSPFRRPGC